jgi:hypothetical protein
VNFGDILRRRFFRSGEKRRTRRKASKIVFNFFYKNKKMTNKRKLKVLRD